MTLDLEALKRQARKENYPPLVERLVEWLQHIHQVNDEIQEYISTKGEDVPAPLLHLLSKLDWNLRGQRMP